MIAGLPYDTEVKWIDTNGAYILTTSTMKNVDDVTICFTGSLEGWTGDQIIGTFRNIQQMNNSYTTGMRLIANQATTFYYFDTGYRRIRSSTGCDWKIHQRVSLEIHSSPSPSIKVDGVDQSIGENSFWGGYITENDPIAICACADGSGQRGRLKIEHLAISQQGTMIIDLIPVRFTNEQGQVEGAMYDRVSRKLFRNSGTGSFIIGPDVATPVMGLHFMKPPKKTPLDYVQTGLIAMWDGIDNAGWGTHNANATTWKDLIGGIELSILNGGSWGDKCLETDGSNLAVMQFSNDLKYIFDEMKHFNVVFSAPLSQYTDSKVLIHYRESLQTGKLMCGCARDPGVTRILVNKTLDMTTTDAVCSYACSSYPNKNTVDGIWVNRQQVSVVGNASAGEFGNGMSIGGANNGNQFCTGKVYSLRIYNRALNAVEIETNYEIDRQRFNLS